MNNILITSAGRRVSLVNFFKTELNAIFPEGKVYAADAEPDISPACREADAYFKVPFANHAEYPKVLLEKCKELGIRLIIPTIDTELLNLAQNRILFAENDIEVVVADEEFVRKCRDKRLIHDFFESKGIAIAKEYDKTDYKLPIFIKPYDGSRSVDTFHIQQKDELTDYHFENEKLLFLKYLDHDAYNEFTCDLYYTRTGFLKCVVPRQRLAVIDGEVNKGITKKNILISHIRETLGEIRGARGCLTAQFFLHKESEQIYGIEINPRFGGGFPLSYLSGANYVKWILKEYLLGEDIDTYYEGWKENLLMLRYDAEILVHGYTS